MARQRADSPNMSGCDIKPVAAADDAPAGLGQATLGHLHEQAAMLSRLPVVSKLLANPEAVDRLAAQSPQLAQMMAANPFMRDMLQPQAVSQLLQAAQSPEALQNLMGEHFTVMPLLHSVAALKG